MGAWVGCSASDLPRPPTEALPSHTRPLARAPPMTMSSSQQPTPAHSAPQTPHTYHSASSAGPSRAGTVEPSVMDDDEMELEEEGEGEGEGEGVDEDDQDDDDEDGDDLERVEVDDSLSSSRAVTPAVVAQPGTLNPTSGPTPLVQIVTDPLRPPKSNKALNFKKKTKTESLVRSRCRARPLTFPTATAEHDQPSMQNVKGVIYQVVDDEITLDLDPRGEAKIDADGNLLGGKHSLEPSQPDHHPRPN